MSLTVPKTDGLRSGYSAAVEISVRAADVVLYPTHVADDRLVFATPQTLNPSTAQLEILVDGIPHRSTIEILPHNSPSTRIPIRLVL
jgi:hypothetical protein